MRLTAEKLERACEELARRCYDVRDAAELLELLDDIAALRRKYGGTLDDVLDCAADACR